VFSYLKRLIFQNVFKVWFKRALAGAYFHRLNASFGDDILPIIQFRVCFLSYFLIRFRICFLILFDRVSFVFVFSNFLGILHDCAFKYSFVFVFVFAFFDTVSYLHSHTV
jgi:hypothetical protein